ncbi:MAG: DNA-binding protein, partial [Azospira oryzae]
GKENCHEEHRCMTHDLWSTLNAKMYEYLASVSLNDLVSKQQDKVALLTGQRLGPRPRVKEVLVRA